MKVGHIADKRDSPAAEVSQTSGLFAAFRTKLGFVTPSLYQNQGDFNDITSGDNRLYKAGPGPDPCTGLGSPIGNRLATLFTTGAAGHNPNTQM
jgi:hypothetical protein